MFTDYIDSYYPEYSRLLSYTSDLGLKCSLAFSWFTGPIVHVTFDESVSFEEYCSAIEGSYYLVVPTDPEFTSCHVFSLRTATEA